MLLAARLANLQRTGGGPRSELGSLLLEQPGADPLEMGIIQHMNEQDRMRQEREARQEEERARWEHALQLQTMQNQRDDSIFARGTAREDTVDARNWQRTEDDRKRRDQLEQLQIEQARKVGQVPLDMRDPALRAAQEGREKERLARITAGEDVPMDPTPGAPNEGPQFGKDQRTALRNMALKRAADLRATGRDAEAEKVLSQMNNPAGLADAAMPRPTKSARDELADLVAGNLTPFADKWQDTDPSDLWNGEGKRPGLNNDPAKAARRDEVITRLLREGRKPEEIGWLAHEALRSQTVLPQTKLNTESYFRQDNVNNSPAWYEYGEYWKKRAQELAAGLRS